MNDLLLTYGSISYAIIYVVTMALIVLMTDRRLSNVLFATSVFAIPVFLIVVIIGIEHGGTWLDDYRYEAACKDAVGEERIVRSADDVEGFAVLVTRGQYAPGEFRDLRRPGRLLSAGYEYVQFGNERFVEGGEDYALGVKTDKSARYTLRSTVVGAESDSDAVSRTIELSVLDNQAGEQIAVKKWVAKKGSGMLCPGAPTGSRGPLTEFLSRVLKPRPATTPRPSAPARSKLTPNVKTLPDFPVRFPSDKIRSVMRKAVGCEEGTGLVDSRKERGDLEIDDYPVFRVAAGGGVRTLYSQQYSSRQAFCVKDAVYLAGGDTGSDWLNLVRLDREARPTHIYASQLKVAHSAGPDERSSMPLIFDFASDGKAIRFTRVYFYAPLTLNEATVRVRNAYSVTMPLREGGGPETGR